METIIEKKKYDITPDKTLIKKLGASGYRINQAIGELIDNSIDAKIGNKKVEIKIKLKYVEKRIEIIDNASGMDIDTLQKAMTLAKSNKDKDKLGRFGLGLKTACSSLGKKFTIITKPINSPYEYVCKYDEASWLKELKNKKEEKTDKVKWDIEITKRQASEISKHGTIIKIEKLNVAIYPNQTGRLKEYFGTRYSPLLEKKIAEIKFNSRECKAIKPKLTYKNETFTVELPTSTITGWVGIKKSGSIIGDYGFNLYNHGRLISLNNKDFFPQHPSVARIVGELKLDGVPTLFNKTAFNEESIQFKEIKRILPKSKEMKYLLQRARKPKYKSELNEEDIKKLTRALEVTIEVLTSGNKEPIISEKNKESVIKKQFIFSKNLLIDGKEHKISVYRAGYPSSKTKKITKDGSEISIEINANSPFFELFKNKTVPKNIILIDAISSLFHFKSEVERENFKDRLISNSFTKIKKSEKVTHKRKTLVKQQHNEDSLSDSLLEIYESLNKSFKKDFYFTATSVLYGFQNHLPSIQYYFVYCQKGYLNKLMDNLKKFSNKFVLLQDPTKEEITKSIRVSNLNEVIIAREKNRDDYQKIEGGVASYDTAFVDLYFEIIKNGVPITESEIEKILLKLLEENLLNKSKLFRHARHRNIKKEIEVILPRDME